jgi:tetratricopeptide (TPR) repeat protein
MAKLKKRVAKVFATAVVVSTLVLWGVHVRRRPPIPDADEAWATQSDTAYKDIESGHYAEAERAARSALIQTRTFAPFDPRRAESLNLVGRACSSQRKFKDAEDFYQQAVAAYRRSPSVDKESVADVICNIGDDYRLQGRVGDAVRACSQVDALDDLCVAPNDIKRVPHIEGEALLKLSQKRYREARAMMKRACSIRRANGVQDKGADGASLKVIAMTYAHERDYVKAETVCAEAISLLEAGKGPDAPGVGRALGTMANVLNHEGKLAKAEPLYHRAIDIFQRSLDPGSAELRSAMDDYAVLLTKMHRNKEAAAYRAKASTIPAKRSVEP